MTTISAGAAAGLLVALMVVATSDSRGAEQLTAPIPGKDQVYPGALRGFSPPPQAMAQLQRQASAR